jgi:hypothetical protein
MADVTRNTRAAALVQETLDRFDELTTSDVLRRAIRVASLREDMRSLWWLEMEASPSDKAAAVERKRKYSAGMTPEERDRFHDHIAARYMGRRTVTPLDEDMRPDPERKILSLSVPEIETTIARLEADMSRFVSPPGLHPVDLYFDEESNKKLRMISSWGLDQHTAVLVRIRQALHKFFVDTESELFVRDRGTTIFDRTREFVEQELRTVAPEVSGMFSSALGRLEDEGDPEALSHAATTCRRILKRLADYLYPARADVVTGRDGRTRAMTDDKYRNRLAQYVDDSASGGNRELLTQEFDDLLKRIELVDQVGSKGVHDRASRAEAEQVVMQTYLITADLLRLRPAG